MLTLAMDTATPRTVVAVLKGRKLLGEYGEASRNHSVTLLPAINQLLSDLKTDRTRIEGLAVGIGPGSFTGLRVGLAMAKTMAYSLDIPLVGVSTLRALAGNSDAGGEVRICAVLDALKNEVYCSVYQSVGRGLTEIQAEDARDPESFVHGLEGQPGSCLFLGTGAQRYRQVIESVLGDRAVFPGDESLHQVQAGSIGRLGLDRLEAGERDNPQTLEPNYCRLSEAELARRSK